MRDACRRKEAVAVRPWTRWQNWLAALVGIWVFISPWVLGTTTSAPTEWNAWIFGVVAVILALWAFPRRHGVGQAVRPADRLDAR